MSGLIDGPPADMAISVPDLDAPMLPQASKPSTKTKLKRIIRAMNPFSAPSEMRFRVANLICAIFFTLVLVSVIVSPYIGVKTVSFGIFCVSLFVFGAFIASNKISPERKPLAMRCYLLVLISFTLVGLIWGVVYVASDSFIDGLVEYCDEFDNCEKFTLELLATYMRLTMIIMLFVCAFITSFLVREGGWLLQIRQINTLFDLFPPCPCACDCAPANGCGGCDPEEVETIRTGLIMTIAAYVLMFPLALACSIASPVFLLAVAVEDDNAKMGLALVWLSVLITAFVFIWDWWCEEPIANGVNPVYAEVTCIASLEWMQFMLEVALEIIFSN